MKFLLDVHISRRIAKALEDEGHEVARAALEWPTASDSQLLHHAIEEGRIVITQDSDFSELIFAHGHPPPPGLIYIRCEPHRQPDMAARLREVLDVAAAGDRLVVITPTQYRTRIFPKGGQHNA